ncbi:MAG: ATP-binding protein [Gemmatimonadales bacterium]
MSHPAPRASAPLVLAGTYALVFVACLLLPNTIPAAISVVVRKDLAYLPLVGISIWLFVRAATAAHQDAATRSALRIIAGALAGMAAGMATYLYVHKVLGVPEGAANPGDPIYILAYLGIAAGLWRLPRRQGATYQRWKLVVDSATAFVAATILIWLFVIVPTTRTPKPLLDFVVTVVYPFLDLALLITLNTIVLAGGPAGHRRAFRLLSAAVVAYVVADSLYQLAYYGSGETGLQAISECIYVVAYTLFAVAAYAYTRPGPRVEPQSDTELAEPFSPLPLVAAGGVTLVLLASSLRHSSTISSPLAFAVIGLTVLLLVRQALTARQNRTLLADQAERRGEARVAALVRHSSDMILVCDGDLMISFASPSVFAVLGTPAEAVMGKPLSILLHPEDFDGARAFVARIEAGKGSLTQMWRMLHTDGSWRPMETVATDLRAEPGVGGIVLSTRDLTERTHLELQLRQAQKMEVVGRLAGGVAHDFNNLLTTILASTEILLDASREGHDNHEDLLTIRQAAGRAAGLTGQLLAFSRQQVLAPRPVDLELLLRETLRMFERLAEGAIRVELRSSGVIPRVLGDPNQLTQVILNLALNARDAMPRGGTLELTLRSEALATPLDSPYLPAPAGRYVVLEFADSGAGMDEATRARLFEPFFTTKPAGKGTGLGLATTLSILEQHRGGITVVSQPEGGTRMTIWLPATDRAVVEPQVATQTALSQTPGGRERVLVVEDEPALRDVARRILERLGYQIETAADAEQARRAINVGGAPALLVTDVIMPGESGPQLAEAMRRTYPHMRVLFISGYTGDELNRFGLRGGELAFLQKPFTPRELAERVREVLDAPSSVGL